MMGVFFSPCFGPVSCTDAWTEDRHIDQQAFSAWVLSFIICIAQTSIIGPDIKVSDHITLSPHKWQFQITTKPQLHYQ